MCIRDRFHQPRFQRLGRTAPRPPGPGARPFPRRARRDCASAEAVMNLQLVWDNLVAYSMQIGLLVGLAAFVPAALRLRLPASRLAYWHILLAACLLLPAVRPWKQAVVTLSAYVPTAITAPASTGGRRAAAGRRPAGCASRRAGWRAIGGAARRERTPPDPPAGRFACCRPPDCPKRVAGS